MSLPVHWICVNPGPVTPSQRHPTPLAKALNFMQSSQQPTDTDSVSTLSLLSSDPPGTRHAPLALQAVKRSRLRWIPGIWIWNADCFPVTEAAAISWSQSCLNSPEQDIIESGCLSFFLVPACLCSMAESLLWGAFVFYTVSDFLRIRRGVSVFLQGWDFMFVFTVFPVE